LYVLTIGRDTSYRSRTSHTHPHHGNFSMTICGSVLRSVQLSCRPASTFNLTCMIQQTFVSRMRYPWHQPLRHRHCSNEASITATRSYHADDKCKSRFRVLCTTLQASQRLKKHALNMQSGGPVNVILIAKQLRG
jgi:hypothetical protein